MDVKAASPQTTLLILLGASEWPFAPEFQGSEAFAKAARRLKAYFLNSRPFGLPPQNLLDLFNSEKSADEIDVIIGQFLEQRRAELQAARNPARDLLVYFIGHGGFVGRDSDFYLAIRRTRMDNPRASGLQMMSLADTLTERARHLRRIIILDCCFAAAAFSAFQSGPAQVALEKTVDAFEVRQKAAGFPTKGTTLLCSSSHKSPSLLLPDGSSTMFTKAFLDALVYGTPSYQDYLTLRDVKERTTDLLSAIRNAPKPVVHSPDQSEGDIADIPFFPNPRSEEERWRRAEEERRRQTEEEGVRRAEEQARKIAEEEQARQAEKRRRHQAEEEERAHQAEANRRRQAEEEERVRQVEEERHRQTDGVIEFRGPQEAVRTMEEQHTTSAPYQVEGNRGAEDEVEQAGLERVAHVLSNKTPPAIQTPSSSETVAMTTPTIPPASLKNVGDSTKKISTWGIDKQRLFAMGVGVLLYAVITYAFQAVILFSDVYFSFLHPIGYPNGYYPYLPSRYGILVGCTLAIPFFFGAKFGPWTGLATATLGITFSDLLLGWTFPGWGFSDPWHFYVIWGLLGFIPGLAFIRVKGHNNIRRSVIIVILLNAGAVLMASFLLQIYYHFAFFASVSFPDNLFKHYSYFYDVSLYLEYQWDFFISFPPIILSLLFTFILSSMLLILYERIMKAQARIV